MLNTIVNPAAIEAGINYQSMLDIDDPQYQAPTVADVHALKNASTWTRGKIAGRLDCPPKQVDKWLAASTSSNKPIPYTAWRVWLLDSGMLTIKGI